MRKMFVLSIAFHLMLAMALFAASAPWKEAQYPPSVYQVDLVAAPAPTKGEKTLPVSTKQTTPRRQEPSVKAKAKPAKPKPKVATKPLSEPKPAVKKMSRRKPMASLPKVQPPETVKPETVQPETAKRVTARPEIRKSSKEEKVATLSPVQLLETIRPETVQPETVKPVTARSELRNAPKSEQAAVSALSVPSVVAGVDIPNFKFPFYLKLVQGKIGSLWSPPAIGISDEPREVVISFTLITTGEVDEVHMEKSSGNAYFDQAALRAVYMANPLPPFPKGFRDPNLKVHFSFILGAKG